MNSKERSERANITSLLNCLHHLGDLVPDSTVYGDKPDCVVTSGGKTIGIEHTLAVFEEVVRASKLHASKCPNQPIVLTHLKDGERRRTNEELLVEMTNPFPRWEKSSDRQAAWGEKIAAALESKSTALNKIGFRLFDENWLLIQDLPDLSDSDYTENWALKQLAALFSTARNSRRNFDTIFVRSGPFLFRWREGVLHPYDRKFIKSRSLIEPGFPT